MAERIDTPALLARTDLVAVVGSFVTLKKAGNEFVACCPFHGDKTPSFTVVPAKGFAHCFGCGWSGDAIKFVQEVEGLDFRAACERLGAETTEWKPNIVQREKPPTVERVTSKPPEDAGVPNMATRELGEPAAVRAFHDEDGAIIGYEARYDLGSNGSRTKQIRMWTWGRRGDGPEGWACGHFSKPRPLYNLHLLKQRPNDPVCITEGPKKADAGAILLPQYVNVSFQGGAQAVKHLDFSPLAGRRLLLWPDADKVGIECMKALARLLSDPRGLACDPVKLVDVSDWADGRDLADCLAENWTPDQVMEWAEPRVKVYAAPQQVTEQNPEADQVPEQATAGEGAPFPSPDLAEGPPPMEFPPEASAERPKQAVKGHEPVPMSEDALAFAFAASIEDTWRYVREWDRWFTWDGDGWQHDRTDWIDRLAVEQCRAAAYWPEAASLTPEGKKRLGQRRTAGAVRDLTKSDRRIAARADQWDADGLMIGVPGGVFDVRVGKIIEASREQYVSKRTSVAPATGTPTRWLEHLRRMTDGDDALIRFLQLYAGYSATGDISEQCFVFLHGLGQTGKGTFCLTLHDLLGSYACMAPASAFMTQLHGEKHASEIARFLGCRLIVIDEVQSGSMFNEERIKRMTGGGKITANFMRCDPFDMAPTWKLLFAGNDKPGLRGVGKEMERRIRLIQCNAQIADEQVDRHFRAKMIAEEGPQIMAWVLDGAVQWHEGGLTLPESIADATREYLSSEDTLGDWIVERCEQKPLLEVSRPMAYRNYKDWCHQKEMRPWSTKAFSAELEKRGYKLRKSSSDRFVVGLSLRAVETPDGPPAWHNYDSDR